ncbi:MAG TPA: hypothetical protein VMV25_10035 [Steroidobacteraceae bacterium]|nr:hypothetical protein [Steroidobacteraceae bacterium]
MNPTATWLRRLCAQYGLFAILPLASGPALAAAGLVTVHAQMVGRHFDAYARVEPISSLPVRTAQAGILLAVRVLPGAAVRKGQELATLGGPEIRALLASREAAVHGAQARFTAASKALQVQRTQLALRLGTQ